MSKIDVSGPAFPTLGNIAYNSDWHTEYGMSLRDWFAGQAAGGLCAHHHGPPSWENIARDAYIVADAMLKAREADPS